MAALPLASGVGGCSAVPALILDARGPVAQAQHDLLLLATLVMLLVVVPVIVMALAFAWRYREGRHGAGYEPAWAAPPALEFLVWTVPALIVVALGALVWAATHRLDPYRPLAAQASPLEIQAVALDWKWLFIYPEQNIASVNELALPVGRPVRLKITSATVMNSLFIPALAGQIYAMAGMQTQLNLRVDRPGLLTGRNAQFSGAGFAEQSFQVHALQQDAFAAWVARARASPRGLDDQAYAALALPSANPPVAHYGSVKPTLFSDVLMRYMPAAGAR